MAKEIVVTGVTTVVVDQGVKKRSYDFYPTAPNSNLPQNGSNFQSGSTWGQSTSDPRGNKSNRSDDPHVGSNQTTIRPGQNSEQTSTNENVTLSSIATGLTGMLSNWS